MSIDRKENGFLFNHELPHELKLDELGLDLKDLSTELRAQIRRLDDLYERALDDGYIDDNEEQELIAESYKISEAIDKKYNDGNGTGEALTVIGGILLLLGTAIGLRQLSN